MKRIVRLIPSSELGVLHGSYMHRMGVYFSEMFPLPSRIIQVAAYAYSFLVLLSLVSGSSFNGFRLPCIIAVVDVLFITLVLRLMDELKDYDIDRTLFPLRPVPSGRVLRSDIVVSLSIVITFYLAINVVVSTLLVPSLILLGYSLLMFVQFFARERHRRSLILSLITHNPIVALILLHLGWAFVAVNGSGLSSLSLMKLMLCVLMYWSAIASWEISRKIRSSSEETDYITYSKILGMRGAVIVTAAIQTVAFCIGIYLAGTMSASYAYYIALSAGYALVVTAFFRFLANPSPHTNRLRSATEIHISLIFLAQFIEYVIRLLTEVRYA